MYNYARLYRSGGPVFLMPVLESDYLQTSLVPSLQSREAASDL